jgi:hypothetical protein
MTREFSEPHLAVPYWLIVIWPRLAREGNRLPVLKAFGGCQLANPPEFVQGLGATDGRRLERPR